MGIPSREHRGGRPPRHREIASPRSHRPLRRRPRPVGPWFSIEDLGALIRRISADATEGLYRLVDAADERRSLALSTNLHPCGFDQPMDKTIAATLVDRLMHPAELIVTEGESVRLADALAGKGVVPLA